MHNSVTGHSFFFSFKIAELVISLIICYLSILILWKKKRIDNPAISNNLMSLSTTMRRAKMITSITITATTLNIIYTATTIVATAFISIDVTEKRRMGRCFCNSKQVGYFLGHILGHILLHPNWSPIENYQQRVYPK